MNDEKSIPGTYVPDNFRVSSWLLKTELSTGAKIIYSVLACCSNGRNYVWPSQEYLAKAASVSVRTVQRYLKELVNFGLIEISKKYLMGKTRSVYNFLNHVLISFEPKKSKVPTQSSPKKSPKLAQNQVTKSTENPDNFDTSYIKEESIVSNKNIPPTPQAEVDLNSAELVSADADEKFSGGEDFNLKPRKEEKAWTEAVKILAQKLSEFDLNCWIQPMLFEKGEESVGILRLPNAFFRNHVEKKFGAEISEVFKSLGVSAVRFELMTTSQQEELDKMKLAQNEARHNEETKAIKARKEAIQTQTANLDCLPLESRFDLLYAAYPVQKERDQACKAFMQLAKKNQLPPMSDMFRSIKEHQAKDRWWREKMPPLLVNWLTNRKWQDKPYE